MKGDGMEEDRINRLLTDEELEKVAAGERHVSDTKYLHKGCGGKITLVDDYDNSFWGGLLAAFSGSSTHMFYYECSACKERYLNDSSVPGKYFDEAEMG